MTNLTNVNVRRFLERFFGIGNKFDLEQIERDGGKFTKIRPWVELLTQAEPLPTVLPCWREGGVDWYGIAQSDRQLRCLSEELMAFVGPSYSTFRGQRAQLNLQDAVESAVYEFTRGAAVKFCGKDPDGRATAVWEALERMRRVSERRVKRIAELPRPTGRVLRDFYMALQAGDRPSAENLLQYLLDQHRLDALNLLFLRVQLLAELEQWDELLALPELPNLLQVRRPFAVTQALLQAVYRSYLQRFESDNAPTSAVTYFQEVVFPRYSNLFAVRAGSKLPEVLKLFMLLAVGGEPPRPALRDELLVTPGIEEPHRRYLQRLAALLPDTTPQLSGDPLQQAEQLVRDGDYDRAFSLLCDTPSSKEKVRLLLQCAYELQTLSAEKAALQAFDHLTPDDQKALQKVRWNQDYLAQMRGSQKAVTEDTLAAEAVPTNWLEWLSNLDKEPSWERALDVARQGASEWDVASLLTEPGAVKQFAQLQEQVFSKAESVLHNALPYLLAFFQKDEQWPRPEFLPVYSLLLELLVLSTEGGDADLVLFNELVIALLTLGVDAAKYIEIVDYSLELWNRFASPKKVDWVLDFLDVLVLYPYPSQELRSQLLFAVANKFGQFTRRIEAEQWRFFRLVVEDLGQEQALEGLLASDTISAPKNVNDADDVLQKLKDKSVLIYTLTESVAIRVKSLLEDFCEGVTVHLSHDKAGNDRLRQLAKSADIVVMATASAKHAATGFIEGNRPKELPILRPSGKGSASMLRIIRSFLEQ